jgi:hypothetical protein
MILYSNLLPHPANYCRHSANCCMHSANCCMCTQQVPEAEDGGKEAIQYLKLDKKQVSKQNEISQYQGESPYWVLVDSKMV